MSRGWFGNKEAHRRAALKGWAKRKGLASFKREGLKLPSFGGKYAHMEKKEKTVNLSRSKVLAAIKKREADSVAFRQSTEGQGGSNSFSAAETAGKLLRASGYKVSHVSMSKVYFENGSEQETPGWLKQFITEMTYARNIPGGQVRYGHLEKMI